MSDYQLSWFQKALFSGGSYVCKPGLNLQARSIRLLHLFHIIIEIAQFRRNIIKTYFRFEGQRMIQQKIWVLWWEQRN